MQKKSTGKGHIKHPDFQNSNVSSLESHPKSGKTLKSPFSKLSGPIVPRSWYDECIPNILWACVLASWLERPVYLNLFRRLIVNTRENVARRKEAHVTHNFLATLSADEFDLMLAPILSNEEAKSYLRALKLVKSLPDHEHWSRHVPDPDPEKDWQILAYAVGETFDHQSQRATDIRWLKLIYLIICQERLIFPESFAEKLEEIRLYPDKGDMRSVRPSIRAMEISTRAFEFGEEPTQKIDGEGSVELPPRHEEAFWKELQETTQCVFPPLEGPTRGPADLCDEVIKTQIELDGHFHATMTTTAPGPRHDGAFGLVLYALTLLINAASGFSHNLVEGRIMLRTLFEAFVTLRYLTEKDDPHIWLQYRRYGSGQAKLAFLKNLREEDTPSFVDLKLLEVLANEDMWMEFQDIDIGHWADLNLRKMAEVGKVKDAYDKYYDLCSGYTHGHWVCVRDTVFVNCLNPLHRFHRVPAPPKSNMPSVLADGCKLVNRMLDDLTHLYPPFKRRVKWARNESKTTKTNEEPAA